MLMAQDFTGFVRERLEAIKVSQQAAEGVIGRDYAIRSVLRGNSLPPLHELHKWAEALQLDDAGRWQLLELADQAHGGGTIARWIIDEVAKLRAEANALRAQTIERDQLVTKLSLKIDDFEKEQALKKGRK